MSIDGNTSDGYHTFNELYDHRIALFCALMRSHKDISWWSEYHNDGTLIEGWIIAGMHLPTGDITYHIPSTTHIHVEIKHLDKAPAWDGHTPSDVVDRLNRFNWKTG